ncbi:MAG TPA: alanyl-tRNA editing protein [Gemmatimonadales bacterium]|nr:alanyl-tRNA editing protein [Gemmatimonadales bacterium]
MTERLYYTDAYLATFDAAVLERADGGRRLYLDRTAFYPTSGGQPNDLGRLGGAPVIDVVDEGERIAHLLAEPVTADRVRGEVDWPRRFDHMQQHTGQHLLSAVILELFGWPTVSVHLGAGSSTLDLDVPVVSPEQLRRAEIRANEVVTENRPVTVSFEDADSAAPLRRPAGRGGMLRVVTIRELDRSACGGTHVRATGEIGPILIRKVDRVRKGARLEFLCGLRAVRRARADHDLLTRLGALLSAAPDDVPALVESRLAELKDALAARRGLEATVYGLRARELHQAAAPGPDGLRRVVVREARGPVESLRGLAQATLALPRAVFLGALAQPPTVVIATSADSGLDAGAALRAALGHVGGKGGGSPRLAQGTVPDASALERAIELLRHPGHGR